MAIQLGPYLASVSDKEMERRWAFATDLMAKKGIDAIIMGGYNNALGGAVRYFTDYGNPGSHWQTLVLTKDGGKGFFAHGTGMPIPGPAARKIEHMVARPFLTTCSYSDDYIPIEIVKYLKQKEVKKLAIFRVNSLPYHFVQYIKDNMDGLELSKVDKEIDYMMAVKSPEEQEVLKLVCHRQDRIYACIPSFLRAGRKERDVAADIRKAAMDLGMEEITNAMIGSGNPKGHIKPYLFENRVIQEGDNVDILIEMCGLGGYWAEISRVWCLGEPSEELIQADKDALFVQAELAKVAKPGVSTHEFNRITHAFQDAHGYKRSNGLYSHGMGTDMAQSPLFNDDEEMELRDGMFIAVHPGMERDTVWGFNCDCFFVTPEGGKRAYEFPQGLQYIR